MRPEAIAYGDPKKHKITTFVYEDVPLKIADMVTRLPVKNKEKNRKQFL